MRMGVGTQAAWAVMSAKMVTSEDVAPARHSSEHPSSPVHFARAILRFESPDECARTIFGRQQRLLHRRECKCASSCCPNIPCERQSERERTSVPCSRDCWPSNWSFAAVGLQRFALCSHAPCADSVGSRRVAAKKCASACVAESAAGHPEQKALPTR